MTKFNLVVELKDDSLCDGCPALAWEWNYYFCNSACKEPDENPLGKVPRPSWCPLIPRTEAKLEPTPLTAEEVAEYQKELKEESDFHRNGNSALGSLFYRNVKKENP